VKGRFAKLCYICTTWHRFTKTIIFLAFWHTWR
jgi:hypothetical protein